MRRKARIQSDVSAFYSNASLAGTSQTAWRDSPRRKHSEAKSDRGCTSSSTCQTEWQCSSTVRCNHTKSSRTVTTVPTAGYMRPVEFDDDAEDDVDEDRAIEYEELKKVKREFRDLVQCLNCFFPEEKGILEVVHAWNTLDSSNKWAPKEEIERLRKKTDALLASSPAEGAQPGLQELETEFDILRQQMTKIAKNARFSFRYKHREQIGGAIHAAALHRQGAEMIPMLLELGCPVDQRCYFNPDGVDGSLSISSEPLHLAAGTGNCLALGKLLEAGANIEAKNLHTWNDGDHDCPREHCTALHEAAFFQQLAAVEFLIQRQADLNSRNKSAETPLHVTARQGSYQIARALISARADISARSKSEETPLQVAVHNGNFYHRKLFILSERSITDVLLVAENYPVAASVLMQDKHHETGEVSVHRSWRQAFAAKKQDIQHWIKLMHAAPQAAEDFLEALTVAPEAENRNLEPLPRHAKMLPGELMRCYYCEDVKWHDNSYVAQGWQQNRDCQDYLVNGSQGNCLQDYLVNGSQGNCVPAKVKVLMLPGIMNVRVLHALKNTQHLHIFTKLSVHGLLDIYWRLLVKPLYWVHIIFRVLEVLVLLVWAVVEQQSEFARRVTWGFLLVTACREIEAEVCEIFAYLPRGHLQGGLKGFIASYVFSFKNMLDFLSIWLLAYLVLSTWDTMSCINNPGLLAIVAGHRWIQLMYTFRAFQAIGQKLIPITQAFLPMFGIVFITAFSFMGFFHAFMALDRSVSTTGLDQLDIFVGTFRLLFLGDGDGIDMVLGLGDTESSSHFALNHLFFVVASIFFLICILNLFIAGTGTAYDEAQELSATRFLQERAAICLQFQFRPSLSPTCLRSCRIIAYFTLMLFSVAGWAGALLLEDLHPAIPSLLFFLASIVGDAFLLRRPEQLSPNPDSYLWICHRADYDESSYWPSACSTSSSVEGRVSSLKRDTMHSNRRITSDILSLRRKLKEVGDKLCNVEDDVTVRLGRIEELLLAQRNPAQSPAKSVVQRGPASQPMPPNSSLPNHPHPPIPHASPMNLVVETSDVRSSTQLRTSARTLSPTALPAQPTLAEEPEH